MCFYFLIPACSFFSNDVLDFPSLQKNICNVCFFIFLLRFRVTKCEKTARDRRTLLITDSNGSVPTSPTEAAPKSRATSESQEVGVLQTYSSHRSRPH